MTGIPLFRLVAFLLVAVLFTARGVAQGPPLVEWVEPAALDSTVAERLFTSYDTGRYADFDRFAGALSSSVINPFEFETAAERWMGAAPDRRRRAFVAAAVALELAAHAQAIAGAEVLPKLTPTQRHTAVQLRFVLAELGCVWLGDDPPSMDEQFWHAAFVSLARSTGRDAEIVTPDARPRLARLAHTPGAAQQAQLSARGRAEYDERWQKEHGRVLNRLRRDAGGPDRPTRIDVSGRRFEHGGHLVARFAGNPLPLFLEAVVLEKQRRSWPSPLLDGRSAPDWLDAAAAERIARNGARQIRAVPRHRRMDRLSADRFLTIVPEPVNAVYGSIFGEPSAAFVSLTLWDIVDVLQAVPSREPVAAEAALHLGHTYARLARPDLALPALARAESLASTPYERYLARLFAGAMFARAGRTSEAITAFRGALQAVPRAQSASFALAPLLLDRDEREEAAAILEAAMRQPLAEDPLDSYYEGDPAATSHALARLREEAAR